MTRAVPIFEGSDKGGAIDEEEDLVMLELGVGVRKGKKESAQVGRGGVERDEREKMRIIWYIICDGWYEYTLNLYH